VSALRIESAQTRLSESTLRESDMSQQGTTQHSMDEQYYVDAPTRTIAASGVRFAYRELGPRTGVPLVLLTHLGANLDGWDPRVVDGLAQDRHVIAVDYRGVGGSTGHVRDSIGEMADDVVAVIQALDHDRVDMFGLAVGGMVAQAVAERAPGLIDRLVLAAAGPAGGPGLAAAGRVTITTGLRAALTFKDPKTLLFFTSTATGKHAARAYLARLKERTTGRDKPVTPGTYRTTPDHEGKSPCARLSSASTRNRCTKRTFPSPSSGSTTCWFRSRPPGSTSSTRRSGRERSSRSCRSSCRRSWAATSPER
jgi:pimeloyl-ACP methyl ester carboxylesterase